MPDKSEMKPLLDRLDSIERKVEVSARGLLPAIALIETAAKGVGVVIKKMEEEDEKEDVVEEKEEEKEEEKPNGRTFEYFSDGRLKSVKCGDKVVRPIWDKDGTVRAIIA
jgi:hypothetical protein